MFCVSQYWPASPTSRATRTHRFGGIAAVVVALLGPLWTGSNAAEPAIDLNLARNYFAESLTMSDRDGGSTWGRPLYGPMLFVDRATRTLVANQSDREGFLRPQDGVFVGRLPDEINCANTATDWAGVHWTMLVWPLPADAGQRASLMMHESYHRIQDELGLPMSNPENRHLDTRDGRTWIQLEWRALDRALQSAGKARREAIRDALTFRARRHRLFEGSAEEERALELNEGLAEYTGVRVAHRRGRRLPAARDGLAEGPRQRTFMRSFAYTSGPAYGLLLDEVDSRWRESLDADADLGALLARGYGVVLDESTEAAEETRAGHYDGPALMAAEHDRDRERRETARRDRQRLLEKSILILTLGEGMRYSFNPSNLRALEELGTVYPTMRVTDRWGVLEVDGDALLIRADGSASVIHVVAPTEIGDTPKIQGDGWSLTLNPGWILQAADRIGDYRLVQE